MLLKNSLRFRIFFSMILFVVIAFGVIAWVTIRQYRQQSFKYHNERILRKEEQLKAQIEYVFMQTTYPVETEYVPLIFKNEIHKISNIQNINFNLYDLQGSLLKSSQTFLEDKVNTCISDSILNHLNMSINKRYIERVEIGETGYQSLYSYVNDNQYKPILILHIPNFENDSFNETSLKESLHNLSIVYLILLLIAIAVAYFISKYITKSLKTIEKHLSKTKFSEKNEKIILENPSQEINQLVTAYNQMIDEIENNKIELAKNEREKAWREMAKQVAHEIKNPLTPMRLTIQSFQRRFDFTSDLAKEKFLEFSNSLIQQIDTLSNIASAFSSFTQMPEQNKEYLDINQIITRCIRVFDKNYLLFSSKQKEIIIFVDKNQINRVVTNLIKNAIQATEMIDKPLIEIQTSVENQVFTLFVKDNGMGIDKELQDKIFEPKFTTKTNGSGLGLAIIKNIVESYQGKIVFISEKNKGTTFIITIPYL